MLADAPTDLATIHAGHRDVETDEVVAVEDGLLECVGTIVGDIDGIALPPQTPRHGIGQFDLIIDHEHSHAGNVAARSVSVPSPRMRQRGSGVRPG